MIFVRTHVMAPIIRNDPRGWIDNYSMIISDKGWLHDNWNETHHGDVADDNKSI